jgi:hypothetical protein
MLIISEFWLFSITYEHSMITGFNHFQPQGSPTAQLCARACLNVFFVGMPVSQTSKADVNTHGLGKHYPPSCPHYCLSSSLHFCLTWMTKVNVPSPVDCLWSPGRGTSDLSFYACFPKSKDINWPPTKLQRHKGPYTIHSMFWQHIKIGCSYIEKNTNSR